MTFPVLAFAAFFSNAFVLAQKPSLTTSSLNASPASPTAAVLNQSLADTIHSFDCQAGQVYTHPNSSASYPVLALDETNGVVVNSSKSWNLTATIAEVTDIYTTNSQLFIQQSLFLDTSSTINPTSNNTSSPFAGCAIILNLPPRATGKTDNGDCTTVFSQQCIHELREDIRAVALSTAQDKDVLSSEACSAFARYITAPPVACGQYEGNQSGGLGSEAVQYEYIDFGSEHGNYTHCTDAPPNNPINFFSRTFEPQAAGDNTTIAQQAKTVTPVLFVLFSNITTYSGPAFADTRLLCVMPGSTSSGTAVKAGLHNKNVAAALLLNTLAFFLL